MSSKVSIFGRSPSSAFTDSTMTVIISISANQWSSITYLTRITRYEETKFKVNGVLLGRRINSCCNAFIPFYVFYEYRSINDQGDRSYDIQWLTEVLETFYNFVSTLTRYDYRDYNSKIWNQSEIVYWSYMRQCIYIFANIYVKWKINMYITHDDDFIMYIVAYYSY